jgi:hypothetical protein
MYQYKILAFSLFMLAGLSSCYTSSGRKSAAYYEKNQLTIRTIRMLYDSLYKHQPFSMGFTDRSFKYYVMEVTTDTLRSIYNNEISEKQLFETIEQFNYDTSMLRQLSRKMKEIECLWIDKASLYLDEKKDTITFLSFKSVLIDKPFVENKYYILLFLKKKPEHPYLTNRLKKDEIVRINDLVYFMIGNKFR